MYNAYWSVMVFIKSKKGQDLPGWSYVVALILGLFAIVFLIWLSVKSGRVTVAQLRGL